MQWVHDRTVDGHERRERRPHAHARGARCPTHLDVGEGYGQTKWNVRAIWENYAGWFHHRSTTELYGVPPLAVAPDLVAAAGADALVAAARAHLDGGAPGGGAAAHRRGAGRGARPRRRPRRSRPTPRESLLDATTNFWERAWLRRSLRQAGAAHDATRSRFDFSGTPVLVTGGTSGIGHAIAAGFAGAGADGRRHRHPAVAPRTTTPTSPAFAYRQLQIADPDSIDALVASLDRLDVLVNNAGANLPGGLDEWDPDGLRGVGRAQPGRARCASPSACRQPALRERAGRRCQRGQPGVDVGVPGRRRWCPATASAKAGHRRR